MRILNYGPSLFEMGEVYATRGVVDTIPPIETAIALARHASGDWGDVCEDDRLENDLSLREGFRILSVYHSAQGRKFWVITEWDRSMTTVLLPEEY